MPKETTLNELGEIMERGFKAVADDVARIDTRLDNLRTELIDQFDHVDKDFEKMHGQLHEMSIEITVVNRRIERLEELGASNAGFAKEIDLLMERVAAIEKHLKTGKEVAA